MSTSNAPSPAAVLRAAYAIGRASVDQSRRGGDTGWLVREAARLRAVKSLRPHLKLVPLGPTHLARYRRIARVIPPDEFEPLAAEVEAAEVERPGTRFPTTFLARVADLPDKKARLRLGRRAVRDGWSAARLGQEVILARKDRRRRGGRGPAVPASEAAALVALEGKAARWVRWLEAATAGGGPLAELGAEAGRPRARGPEIDFRTGTAPVGDVRGRTTGVDGR